MREFEPPRRHFDKHMQEQDEILERNVGYILQQHKRDLNEIKRRGARLRLVLCPLIALWFGFLAWLNFRSGKEDFGVVFLLGSAVFLGMLLFGAIFDRPRK